MSFIVQSFVTNPRDTRTPLFLVGGITISSLIVLFVNNKGFTALFNHSEAVSSKLNDLAVKNLMSRSYQFFSNHKVGSLSGDVLSFARSYVSFMDTIFLQTIGLVVGFTTSLIVIGFMSPILLLPLLLLTIAIFKASLDAHRERGVYRNERKLRTSRLNGSIADLFGNQLLVRVFARERDEISQVKHDRTQIEQLANSEIAIIEKESFVRQAILFGFLIVTLLLAVWLNANQLVSVAALIFAITYLVRITDSLFVITQITRSLEQALLDAAPMTKILSQPVELSDARNASKLCVDRGVIEFDSVVFSYNDVGSDAVFDNLQLTIDPGARVGLAGRSGGGKTTLTKLLLRFADIDDGVIKIDGQNIAAVTQASLRSQISYVPQEPYLFHRSLRENIAYGKPSASENEVIRAAKKAHAYEFIRKLPNGLDTIVGERGIKLSGGQRQRVAIARAILKNAPILILDEATSALDSESEKAIQVALENLMKGKTVIVVAHRLSTIAKLDRIIVLDDGKIAEDGSHAKLLEQNGIYAKLWNHQSGGFIEE